MDSPETRAKRELGETRTLGGAPGRGFADTQMAQKAESQKLYSPNEYLDFEDNAETRSEFDDGVITAMAGGTINHVRITNNVDRIFDRLLKKSCESMTTDMKVRIDDWNKFYYPDVLVICGAAEFYLKRTDIVTNPVLIVEVISAKTEATDRGEKMLAYRTLESLREYVLVSQDKALVEQYTLKSDGDWIHKATIGLKSIVRFESIDVEVNLEEIYQRVDFEAENTLIDG